jgi:hypothetical protein
MTQQRSGRDARRAFTLLEMTLATLIIGFIGVTISSVIMVAARSAPRSDSGSAVALTVADCLALMALDLGAATEVLAVEETYVSIRGPDLDGDSIGDEIGYAFDESEGGRLLRFSSGTLSVALGGVLDAEFGSRSDTVLDGGQASGVTSAITFRVQTADGVWHRRTFRCVAGPVGP